MEEVQSEATKAQIIQVIQWEQRTKYFPENGIEYGEKPIDVIVLGVVKKPGETWIKRLLKTYTYEELLLTEGLPITIERPHTFKQGDVVNLNWRVSKE